MSQYYSANPIADFNRWDKENTDWLNSRPRCYACGEAITSDFAYRWDDAWYCKTCKDDLAENILQEIYQPLPEVPV